MGRLAETFSWSGHMAGVVVTTLLHGANDGTRFRGENNVKTNICSQSKQKGQIINGAAACSFNDMLSARIEEHGVSLVVQQKMIRKTNLVWYDRQQI